MDYSENENTNTRHSPCHNKGREINKWSMSFLQHWPTFDNIGAKQINNTHLWQSTWRTFLTPWYSVVWDPPGLRTDCRCPPALGATFPPRPHLRCAVHCRALHHWGPGCGAECRQSHYQSVGRVEAGWDNQAADHISWNYTDFTRKCKSTVNTSNTKWP